MLRRQSRAAGGRDQNMLRKNPETAASCKLVKVIVLNLGAVIKVQCLIKLKPAVMITV